MKIRTILTTFLVMFFPIFSIFDGSISFAEPPSKYKKTMKPGVTKVPLESGSIDATANTNVKWFYPEIKITPSAPRSGDTIHFYAYLIATEGPVLSNLTIVGGIDGVKKWSHTFYLLTKTRSPAQFSSGLVKWASIPFFWKLIQKIRLRSL